MSIHARSSEDTRGADTAEVVGVDLGVKRLLAAAPASSGPDVTNAIVVDGLGVSELYERLGETLNGLEEGEAHIAMPYRELLPRRFGVAAAALLDYVAEIGTGVVALEDFPHDRQPLAECARSGEKVGWWVLPELRHRLEADLAAAGYRVKRVSPKYTTQQCHVCDELASIGDDAISCTTETCPVDTVCRDRSAAVSIAKRG